MATEAETAAATAAATETPPSQERAHRGGGGGGSSGGDGRRPRGPRRVSHGFIDIKPTPWVVAFSEAQTLQELERLVTKWLAGPSSAASSSSSSSSRSPPPPTLREAVAAVSRLSGLATAASTTSPATREAASLLLNRIYRAIDAPAREAAAVAAATGHAAAARGPVGPALSAAHLLVQSARMRRAPEAAGLGSALATLATSGAGGRSSTNPAVMALWAAIRFAEVEALAAARGKRSRPAEASSASSAEAWQELARRARRDLSALVLAHHAGKDDFGAPPPPAPNKAAKAAGGRGGGGGGSPSTTAPPPVVHSNHFSLAIWSIASLGPPYSPDELRALEVLLQGTARFYSSPPPPLKGGGGNGAFDLADLATLFIGLGRLNADLLPAMSARGVIGGKESFGRGGKNKKRAANNNKAAVGEAAEAEASSLSSSSSSSSSDYDWRSLGQEALMYDLAAAAPDEGPFLRQQRGPGQAGRAASAASPELKSALVAAAVAAAAVVPESLAAGCYPNRPRQGQLFSCLSWGMAMCAGLHDPRAMDAVAAGVARALAPGSPPSVVGSFHTEHLARVPWAFARVRHYAPEMLDGISRVAVPQLLAQAQAQRAAVGAGRGGAPALQPPPPATATATTSPLGGERLFTVQNLANLAWGAAFVGYNREPRLYQAALECAGAPPLVAANAANANAANANAPSSALEADGRPLHLCLLLWAAASTGGGRAPDAFVAAATREVARYDARQLPWTLAMQLLQAAAAGVNGGSGGGGGGGNGNGNTGPPPRFLLPPGALEVLAASAERNRVGSVTSDFQRGLCMMAEAAVQRRRKEWAAALGRGAQGGEGAEPPPLPRVPAPQVEARPPGALIGDVDVLVHWLPPPTTTTAAAEETGPKKRGRPRKQPAPAEHEAPSPPAPLAAPPPVAIALEADGPYHFARHPPTHPLGRTQLRNRSLRALGLSLAIVPHWDWDRVVAEEKAAAEVVRAAAVAAAAAAGGGGALPPVKATEWQRGERAAERLTRLLDEAALEGQASGLP
jgi:hypothetical protein